MACIASSQPFSGIPLATMQRTKSVESIPRVVRSTGQTGTSGKALLIFENFFSFRKDSGKARLFRLPLAQKLRHPARPALLQRPAVVLLQKVQLASQDKPKFLLVSSSLLSKRLKPNKRSRSKLRVDKTLRLKQLNQPKH